MASDNRVFRTPSAKKHIFRTNHISPAQKLQIAEEYGLMQNTNRALGQSRLSHDQLLSIQQKYAVNRKQIAYINRCFSSITFHLAPSRRPTIWSYSRMWARAARCDA